MSNQGKQQKRDPENDLLEKVVEFTGYLSTRTPTKASKRYNQEFSSICSALKKQNDPQSYYDKNRIAFDHLYTAIDIFINNHQFSDNYKSAIDSINRNLNELEGIIVVVKHPRKDNNDVQNANKNQSPIPKKKSNVSSNLDEGLVLAGKIETISKQLSVNSRKCVNEISNKTHQIDIKISDLSNRFDSYVKQSNEALLKSLSDNLNKQKDDIDFAIDSKLSELGDLKEVNETVESLPSKLDDLLVERTKAIENKIDNIQNISSKNTDNLPKNESAVVDLCGYMGDGLNQLESIARYYVSMQEKLDEFSAQKERHAKCLEDAKRKSFVKGEENGKREIARTIQEKYPTEFKVIYSIFIEENVVEVKYESDEILNITEDSISKLELEIDGLSGPGKYACKSPAILLGDDILIRAIATSVDKEKNNG